LEALRVFGTPSGRFFRPFVAVSGVVFCLLTISGCDDQYPEDLQYPFREDSLVTATPETVPTRWDRPGELPRVFSMLEERDVKNLLSPLRDRNRDGDLILDAETRKEIKREIDKHFGTPREPGVGDDGSFEEEDQKTLQEARRVLKLDDETLAKGSALYRVNCLHCHGLTGNGRGPTAAWVNPHPRDFRQGVFKFTSTMGGNERKPRREDLVRTVRMGVEGTAMPSFGLHSEDELEALISYVIHLSIRGEVEFRVIQYFMGESPEESVQDEVNTWVKLAAGRWLASASAEKLIKPDPKVSYPLAEQERKASALRGYQLFRNTGDAGCIGCHADYGRQGLLFFDEWGTIGRPADLTTGIYRGGRRPIDLYWRIHSGITPSKMPAFNNSLSTKDIWDIVNFVQVLPYPQMRKAYGIEIE
jgi:mono/diheme cytochrome c family protein